MIDEEVKDNMQNTNEASIGGLMVKATRYNPQESTYTIEGLSRPKDEPHVHSGDIMEPNNSVNREAYAPPNHGHYGPFYQHDFLTLTNFHPDLQMHQSNQLHSRTISTNQMNPNYTFPVENKIHYQPFGMISQAYQHDIPYQEFQYFVVIDFEATCDKGKNPHPQEIIEFPSVLVNSMTGQMEASFQTYVRPAYHQLLTDFCKELTGIQQIQVDRGVPLSEALLMHDSWLEEKGIKNKNFAVVTWSNWDCRVMLESECRFKSIRKPPYFNRWINLRVPFHKVFGDVRCNLKEAVQLAGLVWEGRAHCGFDDACNTARLLASLMHRGFRFSITNSQDEVSGSGGQPGHAAQFSRPSMGPSGRERGPPTNCHCGVRSSESMIRKPGPTQGRCFFGCGNWTVEKRAVCNYFVWASP